jgi:hypothetical protein
MRERVATYVSMIVSLANKLPEVVEKVEAEKAKTVKSN